jgi:hypothetical protein
VYFGFFNQAQYFSVSLFTKPNFYLSLLHAPFSLLHLSRCHFLFFIFHAVHLLRSSQMAEQPKKAILVGVGKRGATTGSLAGTLTDINNWDNLLKSQIYQMSPNDIVRMYDDDYLVDSDKRKPTHPTTYHVISQVKNAYGEIENKGGDVMLMLSCHGTRWPVGLAQNNSSYVEAAMLAEQTLLTGMFQCS